MIKRKRLLIIGLSLVAFSIGLAIMNNSYQARTTEPIIVDNELALFNHDSDATKDLQSIIHETQKNVVQINVDTYFSDRIGSGFLYNTRGDIITNAHVIEDAKSITVTMSNAETYPAAIVGISKDNDIAVIRVPQLINQTPMNISTNEWLSVGDEVLAVGSPLGFQNSVSIGIISGIDRSFEIDEFIYENVYQISANITHGNSGGPLVDRKTGHVIGINSAGIEDSGIGFSIPIQTVIDEVTSWSTSITDDDLIYPRITSVVSVDPETMQKDANYLISYFFESVEMRDYINAYSLLGSQLQIDNNYPDFRGNYLQYKTVKVGEIKNNNFTDDNQTHITLEVYTNETDSESDKLTWEYDFSIDYENDQLKIIDYKREQTTN